MDTTVVPIKYKTKYIGNHVTTGGKFTAGINIASGQFTAGSVDTSSAPWFVNVLVNYGKNWNATNRMITGQGEDDSRKTLKSKILRHWPFKTPCHCLCANFYCFVLFFNHVNHHQSNRRSEYKTQELIIIVLPSWYKYLVMATLAKRKRTKASIMVFSSISKRSEHLR
jgi:hypothetical protein